MICLKGLMPRARIGLSIPGGIGRPLTGVAAGRALCCLSEPALRRPECGVGRWAEGRGLLLWLSGGCGAVSRIPTLVASCAPLLTPFCPSGASFLAPFSSPASPLLTALCPRLWRVCGRCRGRGGSGRSGLGFRW
jgi:hypothetical protein